jgi:hypothetical protein
VISDSDHGVVLNIDLRAPSTNRHWRKPMIGSIRSGANSMPDIRPSGRGPRGRQPRRPRACADSTLARVRSRGSTRSNRAKAPNTPAVGHPGAVSIPSSRLHNPIPRVSSSAAVAIRSCNERPSRSSRQTTRRSCPSRSSRSARWRSGRSRHGPASANDRSQPAARSISSWRPSPSSSSALAYAYPISTHQSSHDVNEPCASWLASAAGSTAPHSPIWRGFGQTLRQKRWRRSRDGLAAIAGHLAAAPCCLVAGAGDWPSISVAQRSAIM